MQRHVKAIEPIAANAESMWNIDPQLIETATKTYAAWFDRVNRMRDETMRFAQEQFTKELDAAAQLARCTTPTEAFAVQAQFANNMTADFIAEGQKFVEFMGEIAQAMSAGPKSDNAHH